MAVNLALIFTLSIFEFIVWILVFIIYQKLRMETKQKKLEKHHRRKLNTVAEQLTILQPAYNNLSNENKEESIDKFIADENFVEEVPFEKVDKKLKTPEQFRRLKKFIENEKAVTEKAFEKVRSEKKVLEIKEVTNENLPPPPKGF